MNQQRPDSRVDERAKSSPRSISRRPSRRCRSRASPRPAAPSPPRASGVNPAGGGSAEATVVRRRGPLPSRPTPAGSRAKGTTRSSTVQARHAQLVPRRHPLGEESPSEAHSRTPVTPRSTARRYELALTLAADDSVASCADCCSLGLSQKNLTRDISFADGRNPKGG
jgi:hypothetical protein